MFGLRRDKKTIFPSRAPTPTPTSSSVSFSTGHSKHFSSHRSPGFAEVLTVALTPLMSRPLPVYIELLSFLAGRSSHSGDMPSVLVYCVSVLISGLAFHSLNSVF